MKNFLVSKGPESARAVKLPAGSRPLIWFWSWECKLFSLFPARGSVPGVMCEVTSWLASGDGVMGKTRWEMRLNEILVIYGGFGCFSAVSNPQTGRKKRRWVWKINSHPISILAGSWKRGMPAAANSISTAVKVAIQTISRLLRHKLTYWIPFSEMLLMVSSDILDNLFKVREKRKTQIFLCFAVSALWRI